MLNSAFEKDIESCFITLHEGGIILYPTDTIWGVGCDATNEKAVDKISRLKQRPQQKSFVVLVAAEKDILQYTASPDLAVFDYLQTLKKPTTVIYDHALGIANSVINKDGSVAIRICRDDFCRHLIKRFRKPIVSTSANISGESSPQNFSQISQTIKEGVDYVVQHRQDDTSLQAASSIIRWKNGSAAIIRP